VNPDPQEDAAYAGGTPLQVVEFLKKAIEPPLVLRNRRSGDTIRVAPHGTRKVHDIMVEARVPRRSRDAWPVLAMGEERVIWVPGLAVAADLESASSSARGARVRFAWRRLQT
jgi:tRNA(Ile)-lysidine synthetase-like protein